MTYSQKTKDRIEEEFSEDCAYFEDFPLSPCNIDECSDCRDCMAAKDIISGLADIREGEIVAERGVAP